MIKAEEFINIATKKGFGLFAGVPCSYITSLINQAIDSPDVSYVGATNEGDAVAIASGAQLGGIPSVAMFQNSGFGNAVNPLTSLNQTFKIPILLLVTWRGQPDREFDQAQHELMGAITPGLFDLMNIPWELFPTQVEEIEPTLTRAVEYMKANNSPYGLIVQKGSLESPNGNSLLGLKALSIPSTKPYIHEEGKFSRKEMIKLVQSNTVQEDILLATTGYAGRELYALGDKNNQLYQVGSMGCVSSIGLGIALSQPKRRVIVVDGDGAALMRLGALATIGYERPRNLLHILLDNQVHESTGGQSTVSSSVDFCAIAAACGYEKVAFATTLDEVKEEIDSAFEKLTFVHVKIKPGVDDNLPRPHVTPPEVAQRLRDLMS